MTYAEMVAPTARVMYRGVVKDDARVEDNAVVGGAAKVGGRARVAGRAAVLREAWLARFGAWPGEPELKTQHDPSLLDPSWRSEVGDLYTLERNAARAARLRAARA